MSYPDGWTVEQARDKYFEDNGFSEAGYADRWVQLKLGPLPLYIYNSGARKRCIPIHDLHHVATGYRTTWTGEAEIGAWEVAGGCGRHWPAWLLNLLAMYIGAKIAPRRTFRAFVRGRHSRTLYGGEYDPTLLGLTVGQLRDRLGLDTTTEPVASAGDKLAFAGWLAVAIATAVATLALFVVPLALAIWMLV